MMGGLLSFDDLSSNNINKMNDSRFQIVLYREERISGFRI